MYRCIASCRVCPWGSFPLKCDTRCLLLPRLLCPPSCLLPPASLSSPIIVPPFTSYKELSTSCFLPFFLHSTRFCFFSSCQQLTDRDFFPPSFRRLSYLVEPNPFPPYPNGRKTANLVVRVYWCVCVCVLCCHSIYVSNCLAESHLARCLALVCLCLVCLQFVFREFGTKSSVGLSYEALRCFFLFLFSFLFCFFVCFVFPLFLIFLPSCYISLSASLYGTKSLMWLTFKALRCLFFFF